MLQADKLQEHVQTNKTVQDTVTQHVSTIPTGLELPAVRGVVCARVTHQVGQFFNN